MKASSNHPWQAVCLAMLLVGLLATPLSPACAKHREEIVVSDTLDVRGKSLSKTTDAYHNLPLSFEENRGQVDEQVKYFYRGPGYSLFLTATESVIELRGYSLDSGADRRIADRDGSPSKPRPTSVRLKLVGSNASAVIKGADELPGKINYFIGNDPKKWRTNIPAYKTVSRRGVYPGVDIVYYGSQQKLEYDLIVAPGADPEVIRLGVGDVRSVRIDEHGDLVLKTEAGDIRQHRPFAYQEEHGIRREVQARYAINREREVRFEIGGYDAGRPLVIDPVLTYSTYLGGTAVDEAYGIAVDSDGNAYVTGTTASTAFPTARAFQPGRAGGFQNSDVFVAKLNPSGSALVYSTYLGGDDNDEGYGIAVDAKGTIYVTGETYSRNFPTTEQAFQRTNAGRSDAFVAKLSAAGDMLAYSTYLGGSVSPSTYPYPNLYNPNIAADTAFSIAVDPAGNAYVTGRTYSSDFPTKKPLQKKINEGSVISISSPPPPPPIFSDVFVTELNASGSDLVYSTFLGGSGNEEGRGIAVDASGSAYVAGFSSSGGNGPGSSLQPAYGGGASDGFVVRLAPLGKSFVFSTWLGGSGNDKAYGIALDPSGNCYVTGETDSVNFPTTINAFAAELSGGAVYRSTDGGATWSTSARGLPRVSIDHLIIDPVTPTTLYAGFIGYGTNRGLFKSTDGGNSWNAANNGLPGAPNFSIASLAIDSKNPSTLYVISYATVFKSTDGAATWSAPNANRQFYIVGPISVDPAQPNTLYVGLNMCPIPGLPPEDARASEKAQTARAEVQPQDFPPAPRALLKSTDGGVSWTSTAYPGCAVGSLTFDSKNPTTLYSSFGGILKTTDGGDNWSRRNVFATVLAVDPADSSIVYAAQGSNTSAKLTRSTDGGETWEDSGLAGVSINALVIDPNNPSTLYAATGNLPVAADPYYYTAGEPASGGGVFKSTDRGVTWRVTSLNGTAIKQLAISPVNPSTLYAGAFHNSDAFVTKINSTGTAIVYSTYLGGTGRDAALAIAVDAAGNAYVAGQTYSGDFPTQEAIQARRESGPSATGAFIAKLNPEGRSLMYSTHLGGRGEASGSGDVGQVIAVDTFGKVYVAGVTASDDFPTKASIQSTNGGDEDAFVAKIVLPPKIISASISGKNLVVTGENFDKPAVILLDSEEKSARNDGANPSSILIGKKLGKKIAPGQRVIIQVRTSEGMLSNEFSFVRPG